MSRNLSDKKMLGVMTKGHRGISRWKWAFSLKNPPPPFNYSTQQIYWKVRLIAADNHARIILRGPSSTSAGRMEVMSPGHATIYEPYAARDDLWAVDEGSRGMLLLLEVWPRILLDVPTLTSTTSESMHLRLAECYELLTSKYSKRCIALNYVL